MVEQVKWVDEIISGGRLPRRGGSCGSARRAAAAARQVGGASAVAWQAGSCALDTAPGPLLPAAGGWPSGRQGNCH
jgi:hypothetical protein